MHKVNIGIVGAGFIAELHAESYARVSGYDAHLAAVAAPPTRRAAFQEKYGISKAYETYEELLADECIDVIDICTPPALHVSMIRLAIEAGKHVICEKPLTGFFDVGDFGADGVDRAKMYETVISEMDELRLLIEDSDRIFCYAENYVYAPSVQRSRELLESTDAKVLLMRGEESHNGSHAPHASRWRYTGGGAMTRQGCHPLSAMLYLKRVEGSAQGKQISVASVLGDAVALTPTLSDHDRRYLDGNPVDVEDLSTLILSFEDGTRGIVTAGDMIVGGVRNIVEVFTNHSVHLCKMSPNDAMMVYHSDPKSVEDVYITEKVGNKSGWQSVFLDELLMRGYLGEMQDFIECIAEGRRPQADFNLAYDTIQTLYAGYLSAATDRRVRL